MYGFVFGVFSIVVSTLGGFLGSRGIGEGAESEEPALSKGGNFTVWVHGELFCCSIYWKGHKDFVPLSPSCIFFMHVCKSTVRGSLRSKIFFANGCFTLFLSLDIPYHNTRPGDLQPRQQLCEVALLCFELIRSIAWLNVYRVYCIWDFMITAQ